MNRSDFSCYAWLAVRYANNPVSEPWVLLLNANNPERDPPPHRTNSFLWSLIIAYNNP